MKPFPMLVCCLFFLARLCNAQDRSISCDSQQTAADRYIEGKNFYLLSLLKDNPTVRQQLEKDPIFSKIIQRQNDAILNSIKSCSNYKCITVNLKLTSGQIKMSGDELLKIYAYSKALQKLVIHTIIPSNRYIRYKQMSAGNLLKMAWTQDATDINHILEVYAEGVKPNYPDIDSISFNINNREYTDTVKNAALQILKKERNSKLFFMPSMTAALYFLHLNARTNTADYEPMESTVNKLALERKAHTVWANFPYTILLVPGEGPDSNNTSISPGSILRCQLAADAFQKHLAPFIMVSGGKVHPYKTIFCEAVEMKKYLIDVLKVPENAILLEPHARHTTTNMRNGVRLLLKYDFPRNRPALVVTDTSQSAYITNMSQRCIDELGYVPYQLGRRLSATSQEFYATPIASQINPLEPLDP